MAIASCLGLALALQVAPGLASEPEPPPYRLGLNMLRTTPEQPAFDTPGEVMDDLVAMGAQGMRQLRGADLSWAKVYRAGPWGDARSYDLSGPDAWLRNEQGLVAMPTLFQLGPESAARALGTTCSQGKALRSPLCLRPHTPDGSVLDVRDPAVAKAVQGYLAVVGTHYRDTAVRTFEVGNELELYAHRDLGLSRTWSWGPRRYADLLALTRRTLDEVYPEAHLVLGGLSWHDQYDPDGRAELWERWLDRVLSAGGGDQVDAISLHYYGRWEQLSGYLDEVRQVLARHGVDTPLWLTELGRSAATGGEAEQADELVRSTAVAFGEGVQLVNWHTHISSHDEPGDWGGYGTRARTGQQHASWTSYQALARNLGDFSSCRLLSTPRGVWAGVFQRPGRGPAIVAWDVDGSWALDASQVGPGPLRLTELVPDATGTLRTRTGPASEDVPLGSVPLLIEAGPLTGAE